MLYVKRAVTMVLLTQLECEWIALDGMSVVCEASSPDDLLAHGSPECLVHHPLLLPAFQLRLQSIAQSLKELLGILLHSGQAKRG